VSERPATLLVAAMGGEGGGVLADWVVQAAQAEGLAVQATSIPGVAQRTGATTYYIEMLRTARLDRGPVFSLYPSPGGVDLMVASELLEAGRALQNGFVTPDRTTLIASTHRVYAIAERAALADGRYDSGKVLTAAGELAREAVLFDLAATAEEAGCVISAVMLGAIAGAGALPIPVARFEDAVRGEGKAVASNLAGFRLGLERARAGRTAPAAEPPKRPAPASALASETDEPLVREGVNRLVDYQDADYAKLYLTRLATLPPALLPAAARQLALWMSYEDVIRVAQAKTRRSRYERLRQEVRARPGEVVQVSEFMKPGIEELAGVLPPALARRALRWGEGRKTSLPLTLKSSTVTGFLLMRLLASLRRFRRRGWRFAEEQAAIEAWLDRVRRAADLDPGFALEVVECARLLKGYSDTARRGRASFDGLMATLVDPALRGEMAASAEALRRARLAALGQAAPARAA
jgi:indolepyruvate ferredoxin oxidoreductase beta subunit